MIISFCIIDCTLSPCNIVVTLFPSPYHGESEKKEMFLAEIDLTCIAERELTSTNRERESLLRTSCIISSPRTGSLPASPPLCRESNAASALPPMEGMRRRQLVTMTTMPWKLIRTASTLKGNPIRTQRTQNRAIPP